MGLSSRAGAVRVSITAPRVQILFAREGLRFRRRLHSTPDCCTHAAGGFDTGTASHPGTSSRRSPRRTFPSLTVLILITWSWPSPESTHLITGNKLTETIRGPLVEHSAVLSAHLPHALHLAPQHLDRVCLRTLCRHARRTVVVVDAAPSAGRVSAGRLGQSCGCRLTLRSEQGAFTLCASQNRTAPRDFCVCSTRQRWPLHDGRVVRVARGGRMRCDLLLQAPSVSARYINVDAIVSILP